MSNDTYSTTIQSQTIVVSKLAIFASLVVYMLAVTFVSIALIYAFADFSEDQLSGDGPMIGGTLLMSLVIFRTAYLHAKQSFSKIEYIKAFGTALVFLSFALMFLANFMVMNGSQNGIGVLFSPEGLTLISFSFLGGVVVTATAVLVLYFMPGKQLTAKDLQKRQAKELKRSGSSKAFWAVFSGFNAGRAHITKLHGQEKTEAMIEKAVKSYDVRDGKPLSLLFCGASGVGKTEMVSNLSKLTGVPLHQFNMADFGGGGGGVGSPGTGTRLGRDISKDALIGMPPGYVDSEKGGLLTNALGKNPQGIFLFDEMEKAGAGVYDIFLNLLDKGWINDARGRRYNCSDATFIFTTNIARDVDPDLDDAKIRDKMVREGFRPELVGRLHKAIVFRPLSEDVACSIAKDELGKAMWKLGMRYGLTSRSVEWHPESMALRAAIGSSGYEKYGVRVIAKTMNELAMDILNASKDKKNCNRVVLYPAKHGKPSEKVLKGALALPVGVGSSIDTKALFKHMTAHVKGQDHAANTIIEQINLREMGLVAKSEQPQGTYLFTGPSGTGKTELVKQLAEHLGRKFIFFNMGNFKGENGVEAFFGPPPGYVGSEDGGQLTNAVMDYPDAVILLDEIEKGNPKIWDAFMSVFDDGVAKDNSTGEMVPFKNTMIFMTSNLVTENVPQNQIRDYLRETGYFRPEMINRIENIVAFNPLGDDVKRDIVSKILNKVLDNYNKTNGLNVVVKPEWLDRFTEQSDFTHGARDIERMIQKELAKELIEHG